MLLIILIFLIISFSFKVDSLDNGLARTPPMGWLHWERYRCNTDCVQYPDECVHENLFKKTADLLVEEGYADAGYEYVIIDDCWMETERDSLTQKLVPHLERFPNGFNNLSDYIHSKNLKFGLYESYGSKTCEGYPGIIDHMALDAQTFADWGVDYIKLDGCNSEGENMNTGYPNFGFLLNKTGRPIVYSCSWPFFQERDGLQADYSLIQHYCNLWRFTNDINDSYKSLKDIIDYVAKEQTRLQPYAGPGHWNDPDMLLLGNFGLSYEQSKAQMAIWSILAAPLIMSNDLANIKKEIKDILINKEVIAVNQDELGIQGELFFKRDDIEIWRRPITPIVYYYDSNFTSYAFAFLSNRVDGHGFEFITTLQELKLPNYQYVVTDLYNKEFTPIKLINSYGLDSENANETFKTRINPTGVQFFKFTSSEFRFPFIDE